MDGGAVTRLPRGGEAQCGRCARFFGSDSAFDRHLTRDGCADPAGVRNKKGELVLKLVERKGGPTWVGADQSPWAFTKSASRILGAETP